MRTLVIGLAGLVSLGLALGACGAIVAGGVADRPSSRARRVAASTSSDSAAASRTSGTVSPSTGAPDGAGTRRAVPASWEAIDRAAAGTCPGLPWTVLAAIGRVESDSGRSRLPGVRSGANADGAEGPMQFEASTFAAYAVAGPGGAVPPSPYDPVDAVYTAAQMLCANGARSTASLSAAIYDYDHSPVYVRTVIVLADALREDPALGSVAAGALAYAAGELGVPYRWGGEEPGVGFDCSGLAQAAYRAAGVRLPRVAQAQFGAGPLVAPGAWTPGDLVFFGRSARSVSHVGIYLGGGEMIDAPHAGAVVRVDRTPTVPGARWGAELVVGATRPALLGAR